MDKRTNRVQPIRLSSGYVPLDIHKSMMINDLTITIPTYHVVSWGKEEISKHVEGNTSWKVDIEYSSPRDLGSQKMVFNGKLYRSAIKDRKVESSYRLTWHNDFAVQLAKDYPKSFVRALEFHIGDERYKEMRFTEFDIGGFKEQLQLKVEWENNVPKVSIKELFRVKEVSQVFPKVFNEMSTYLIADYLLSTEEELLRRIQVSEWKQRIQIDKEMNENNLYLLLNRDRKGIYVGETRKSMSQRYPVKIPHHTFDEWEEYCIIQLPRETSDHTRLLVERVLIAVLSKLFPSQLTSELSVLSGEDILNLKNRKKS